MNKKQLINRLKEFGFSKEIVLAFQKIDRERFIPEGLKEFAYEDIALPIGYNQTISQPYTIAFMLSLLDVKDKQKILEIGSGSGYVLALLSILNPSGRIIGVEQIKELADKSKEATKNIKNIKIIHKNGSKGLIEEAPFDRILVSASAKRTPKELIAQLSDDGILVIPVKSSILRIKKNKESTEIEEFPGFSFVPLVEQNLKE